jgi:hypothetical protein
MMRLLLVVACLLSVFAAQAQAQAFIPSLRLRSALHLAESPPLGPALSRRPFPFAAALEVDASVLASQASAPRQRVARQLLAAGIGFSLAAAVTPMYVLPTRSRCWSSDRRSGGPPLKGAAVLGAIGIGMAIGGGSWLGVETRRYGPHTSRRERLLAMAVGALAFTLGQAALVPVFIADQICHS